MSSAADAAARARAVVLGVALGAVAGCKSPPAPAPAGGPGIAACRTTLRGVPALAPADRVAAVLRGCPVCGQSFEPLIAAAAGHADLAQIGGLMAACAPGCPKAAVGRWRDLLADTLPGEGVLHPWRALATDCPTAMHTDAATTRYASAPWFGLAVIGDRLAAASATLPPSLVAELDAARAGVAIPMPPWTISGTGLVVAPGAARAGTPWRHVTVSDRAFLVGRLAIGRLDGAGWHLDAPGPAYPGVATTGDLARDLAALGPPPAIGDRLDDVMVIAPTAAPAARAIAALLSLGTEPSTMAVAVPEATGLWRGAIAPHRLRLRPAVGARVRVDLVAGRIAAVAADGTVRASTALPAGPTLRARWRAAIGIASAHPVELVADVPAELAVDGLVELFDDAAAAGATSLAIAAAGASTTTADRGAFDPAALTAALAP